MLDKGRCPEYLVLKGNLGCLVDFFEQTFQMSYSRKCLYGIGLHGNRRPESRDSLTTLGVLLRKGVRMPRDLVVSAGTRFT